MSANMEENKKEAAFALAALMEIPFQYRATQGLRPMKRQREKAGGERVLPPPREVIERDNQAAMSYPSAASSEPAGFNIPPGQACPICLTSPRNMAFGCGHLTCKDCGATLTTCPMCRAPITTRVRLFS